MASLYWNADIVKLLFDYQTKNNSPDLASFRDTNGRLRYIGQLPAPDATSATSETSTSGHRLHALHLAIQAHATCGASAHAESAIRCLLEHGADPSIPEREGQSVLHMLGHCSLQGEPFSSTLLDLLMSHGADINAADSYGNTPLRVFV
ncbi:hypothetical protein BDV06DRAFT_228583 [Aspergillus oleicola]